jgi:16S rRNA (uracil1498-N3)-methyltransferase
MALPFFFEENLPELPQLRLGEESSKHITQVLRMKAGEPVLITNGKGTVLTAGILSPDKKKTEVQIIRQNFSPYPGPEISIAISLIKNTHRFEWFAEKATELGIFSIIPLLCRRTEKTHFRSERIRSILVSAMLQSRQAWLPAISEPRKITDLIKEDGYGLKFIAHCAEEERTDLKDIPGGRGSSAIILIGPEGDFTQEEIADSVRQHYVPVSLGATRLRTETAGVVAAVLLKSKF